MYELSRHLKHFSRCMSAANRPCLLADPIADIFVNPKRTTFILKRRYPAKAPKIGETEWKLKGKDYIYDLVQDTDVVKKPDVSIVLKKCVDGVGLEGDVVSLPRLKAYTQYIVTGLADFATPEIIEAAKIRQSQLSDGAERASSRFAPLVSTHCPLPENTDA